MLSPSKRAEFLSQLTEKERIELFYRWPFWARAQQVAPEGNWQTWLVMAGRGFGKTRTGAEWVRDQVQHGGARRVALVARTAADVRDVMVEGESGILACSPPWFRPKYEPSRRRLTWPNGAIATTYSAEEPKALRGPQHDKAWGDEPGSWPYPDTWDQLQFGLRLGDDPRSILTTTPRPVKLIRDILKDPSTVVTRGTSYENRGNLAPQFYSRIITRYEGTRLGRQELLAEMLDDNPNALWQRAQIDNLRIRKEEMPELSRIVVAIDPSVHDGKKDDGDQRAEAGIIAAGIGRVKGEIHGYVLADWTVYGSPAEWAGAAVQLYHDLKADRIVAETNQGGAMVEGTVRAVDKKVSYKGVHASRGKVVRAEPVSALYEKDRVHHVGGFAQLEDELCDWMPGMASPNRLDALVWAITELMLEGKDRRLVTF